IAQSTPSIMTFDHACIDLLISQQIQDMLEFGFAMHYPDFNPIWMAAFGNVGVRQAGRLGMPLYTSPIETLPQLQARDTLYRE
ncbi:hypothetical protein C2W62_54080, partial [Candidatus Entotheonella serta]